MRRVRLDPFWIDACAVSNGDFALFVEETGHETEAERFGWSFVFAGRQLGNGSARPRVRTSTCRSGLVSDTQSKQGLT